MAGIWKKERDLAKQKSINWTDEIIPLCLEASCRIEGSTKKMPLSEWSRLNVAMMDDTELSAIGLKALHACGFKRMAKIMVENKDKIADKMAEVIDKSDERMQAAVDETLARTGTDPS